MWRNPKYADQAARQAPAAETPRETGRRLVALPRSRRGGPDEELRVSLDEYQGHPYISVRLWTQDARSGAWWPSKKGVSVRLAEAEDVADALREALRVADAPGGARPAKGGTGERPRRREGGGPRGNPGRQAGGRFDEFGE